MNGKHTKNFNSYIIYTLIMLALLAIMGILVMWPAFQKIVAIKNEISQEKTDLENKLSMGLNVKKTKEDLDRIEKSISTLDTVYIVQGEELGLLSTIEALAAKNQVTVNIKPDFKGYGFSPNILRIPLNITAGGKFNNLIAFLNDLDGVPFYFIGDQINFSKTNQTELMLAISGQVYMKTSDKK
jgi:Tfp pilus assembly protein PilO